MQQARIYVERQCLSIYVQCFKPSLARTNTEKRRRRFDVKLARDKLRPSVDFRESREKGKESYKTFS